VGFVFLKKGREVYPDEQSDVGKPWSDNKIKAHNLFCGLCFLKKMMARSLSRRAKRCREALVGQQN
jgi:hypothetical protein